MGCLRSIAGLLLESQPLLWKGESVDKDDRIRCCICDKLNPSLIALFDACGDLRVSYWNVVFQIIISEEIHFA